MQEEPEFSSQNPEESTIVSDGIYLSLRIGGLAEVCPAIEPKLIAPLGLMLARPCGLELSLLLRVCKPAFAVVVTMHPFAGASQAAWRLILL